MTQPVLHDFSWQRVINAVNAVDRCESRCVESFDRTGIDYAIVGGRAAMAWVESVDRGASRTTPNVDFLVNRTELPQIIKALTQDGWVHQVVKDWHTFAESPSRSFRSRVRLVVANEFFRPDDLLPTPSVNESRQIDDLKIISLEALIRMKLTAFRTIDRVHLDDLLSVGLFDPSWKRRFPQEFGSRLDEVFDAFEVWPTDFEQAMLDAGITSDEQLVEIERRSKELDDGTVIGLPWFLARKNARQRIRLA